MIEEIVSMITSSTRLSGGSGGGRDRSLVAEMLGSQNHRQTPQADLLPLVLLILREVREKAKYHMVSLTCGI